MHLKSQQKKKKTFNLHSHLMVLPEKVQATAKEKEID